MKPIYINHQHEAIVQCYLDTVFDSVREVVKEEERFNDFRTPNECRDKNIRSRRHKK